MSVIMQYIILRSYFRLMIYEISKSENPIEDSAHVCTYITSDIEKVMKKEYIAKANPDEIANQLSIESAILGFTVEQTL